MTDRDPKTGRFVKKERKEWRNYPKDSKLDNYLSSYDKESAIYGIDYAKDHTVDALSYAIQNMSNHQWNKGSWFTPNTKTPTNYWNYILVGVLGMVMLIIGYELHELLPIH